MNGNDPYTYPGSAVLRNKLGITDGARLDNIERVLVTQRAAEGIPSGYFDLGHLRAIHRHLFQDLYEWAGEIRQIEIAKDGHQFQFRRYIATGMADVHRRLEEATFLKGLLPPEFTLAASRIVGDVNYVHPFREGNGRAQMFYLAQLAIEAGHDLDLLRIRPERWIMASRASHKGDYDPMAKEIANALIKK